MILALCAVSASARPMVPGLNAPPRMQTGYSYNIPDMEEVGLFNGGDGTYVDCLIQADGNRIALFGLIEPATLKYTMYLNDADEDCKPNGWVITFNGEPVRIVIPRLTGGDFDLTEVHIRLDDKSIGDLGYIYWTIGDIWLDDSTQKSIHEMQVY